ncbi:metal-dependent phosphohydrolase [Streptomyces sp. WMMC500]|uniref:metal-dependent phosphohydrolase n=1 Tax=Streptomyces sp. WMMC500 TaxID=3015154 RepID=UPI00248CA109|nr:metal-dependent phosphohydrolase [Streptomyces sp. WMMC500]WBB63224.1 metal-dependent phosphohydrolase [Streptomyces sp. WMMC500]
MSESVLRSRHRTPPEVRVAVGAAGAVTAAGFCWTLAHGLAQPGAALAFGLLIVVGEVAGDHRASTPARIPAPLATAGALGYALLCIPADTAGGAVLEIAAVSFTATVVGAVPHVARGRGPTAEHLVRRVLGTAFAAACCRPLCAGAPAEGDGAPVAGLTAGPVPLYVPALLGVLALTALCDAVLAACLARARTGWPYGPLLRDELRALPGAGSAMCATGVVIALAAQVAGVWALPVLSLPLLLTQVSFRRYAAVRRTYRQTIASLARATEMAGYHTPGHAHRVASLSRAIGRVRGLTERELDVLEQAALMHDLGKLSLADPAPPGAEGPPGAAGLADRRRIALLGGAVVRQTGVAAEVAVVVERQAEPYRDQPVAARIVRVAAAYDVLVTGNAKGEGAVATGPLAALERLRLAPRAEYDPAVVDALREVLANGVHAN